MLVGMPASLGIKGFPSILGQINDSFFYLGAPSFNVLLKYDKPTECSLGKQEDFPSSKEYTYH